MRNYKKRSLRNILIKHLTMFFTFNSEVILQFEAFIPISYPVPYPRCCRVVDGPGYLASYLTRYPTRYPTPCRAIFWYMDKAFSLLKEQKISQSFLQSTNLFRFIRSLKTSSLEVKNTLFQHMLNEAANGVCL